MNVPTRAPAARLFALAAAIGLGALAAERIHPNPVVVAAIAATSLLLVAIRPRTWLLLIAVFAFGLTLAGLRISSAEHGALARGAARNADAVLRGEVLTDPESSRGAARFMLGVREARIDGRSFKVRERAWVTARPPPPHEVRTGSLVRIDARLRAVFFRGLDASGRASVAGLLRKGIAARAFTEPDRLEVIGRSHAPLTVVADAGRAAVRRAARYVSEDERALLLGVTIGDTSLLDAQTEQDFRTTGLTHLLAVSGENVAMVLVVVAALLRLARAGRRTTIVVMGICVLSFCAITRFEPSVMRAGAMTAIVLVGTAIGARRSATNVLAVATVMLLVYDPFLIESIGFQLSVLATIGILVLAPRIAEQLPPGKLAGAMAITLGAQLAVAPILVLNFHQLSLISIAANLVVMPAVAPATVGGMVSAGLGALWHPAARLSMVTGPPINWMRWVAHALAQLPLASVGTPVGALGLVIAAILTAAALAAARGKRPRRAGPVLLALALIVTGGVWARAIGPAPLGRIGLVVTMIDVGQGDAILVRAGGKTMLIDGGPDARLLLRELAAERVRRIDLLVLSHPHADHIDGLVPVAESFPIGRALDPFTTSELSAYHDIVDALARRHIARDRAVVGMRYVLGPAIVDVLWPGVERMEGTGGDINNNSIVLRIRYGNETVLLAGETQEEAQEALLQHPELLRADVLKVSHHGSAHMLPSFYAATGARVALIPVGPNTFGHPAPQTLVALRGMRILRSDRSGTVSVALDGSAGFAVREERHTASAA